MGLDTSHNCWHGAYSAFSRWRHKIARVAGYDVFKVVYEDGYTQDTIMIDWGHITGDNLMGKWEILPKDPLIILFAHSDCEGVIYPDAASLLADRLEELLPLLDGDGGGHIGSYKDKTMAFIDGLRNAAIVGEVVDFH